MKAALRMEPTTGRNSSSSTAFLFLISISPPVFIPIFFLSSPIPLSLYLAISSCLPLPSLCCLPIQFSLHIQPTRSSSAAAVSMPVLISNCSGPCTYIYIYLFINSQSLFPCISEALLIRNVLKLGIIRL